MMLAIPQLPDKGASLRALACNLPVNRLICRQSANARNWGIYSYADNECIFSAARMRIHTIFRYLFPTPHRVKYLLPCRNDEASYGVGESYGNRRGEVRAVCHRATTLNVPRSLCFVRDAIAAIGTLTAQVDCVSYALASCTLSLVLLFVNMKAKRQTVSDHTDTQP